MAVRQSGGRFYNYAPNEVRENTLLIKPTQVCAAVHRTSPKFNTGILFGANCWYCPQLEVQTKLRRRGYITHSTQHGIPTKVCCKRCNWHLSCKFLSSSLRAELSRRSWISLQFPSWAFALACFSFLFFPFSVFSVKF